MKKLTKDRTKNLALTALFTALIAAGAFIKIPIPPVPFSLQTLFVTLAGLLLGGGLGAASVAVYVLLGLVGLPIFTAGGGFSYVLQPTFGYLIGFIPAAFLTGAIARKTPSPSYGRLFAAGFAGVFTVYAVALPYFYLISELYLGAEVTMRTLFLNCFLLTLPADVVKTVICVFLAKKLIPFCPVAFRKTNFLEDTKTPETSGTDGTTETNDELKTDGAPRLAEPGEADDGEKPIAANEASEPDFPDFRSGGEPVPGEDCDVIADGASEPDFPDFRWCGKIVPGESFDEAANEASEPDFPDFRSGGEHVPGEGCDVLSDAGLPERNTFSRQTDSTERS